MNPIIEARELSKWFGEAVAVNNLSLTIENGVTGLLGPNGAGKSTFMKLALGMYAPSRGRITVLGEPPRNNLRILRKIGYCPELENLHENMTGYEFVYWLNRYWGMPVREARNQAILACEMVNMASRMDDPIVEYSRGMRQRIKIAQAIAIGPEVLFLDEPMTGLDPMGREEMFALIRTLGEQGRAVIVSSHVLYEIERVTNNVVLLHNGSILAYGPVQHIRELMAEHPRTITLEGPEPRALAARFLTETGTRNIELAPNAITIQTIDPDGFFDRLNAWIVDGAVTVTGIRCIDDDLQSVFDYLVK